MEWNIDKMEVENGLVKEEFNLFIWGQFVGDRALS